MGASGSKPNVRVLVAGIDGAGKTSLLFMLKLGRIPQPLTPTLGWHAQMVKHAGCKFLLWDVGGQERLRPLWRHHFHGSHAVIFVIDSTDPGRMHEAAAELHAMMADHQLVDSVLLVLANKQDSPDAVPPEEIARIINLEALTRGGARPTRLQATSTQLGSGLWEGVNWLGAMFARGR